MNRGRAPAPTAVTLDAPAGSTTCPSENELIAFVAHKLPPAEQASIVAHIDACPICLDGVAHLARASGATPAIGVRARDPVATHEIAPARDPRGETLAPGEPVPLPHGFPRYLDEYEILACIGQGGTIPLMSMLQQGFPQAQMMVCGVLGPKSNAHGPNEFLHVPYGKKLTAAVAQVIAACP